MQQLFADTAYRLLINPITNPNPSLVIDTRDSNIKDIVKKW
jgi:hypothetical protein